MPHFSIKHPDILVKGVLVSKMITYDHEFLVGGIRDPN